MMTLTKDANTVLLTTFKDNLYDEVDNTRYWKLYDGAVENTTNFASELGSTRSIQTNSTGYAELINTSGSNSIDIPCLYDGQPWTIEEYVYIDQQTTTGAFFTTVQAPAGNYLSYGICAYMQTNFRCSLQTDAGNAADDKHSPILLTTNAWNYIAFVYSQGKKGIKINNNPITILPSLFTSFNPSKNIRMGNDSWAGVGLGTNLIGAVRISNVARWDLRDPSLLNKKIKQY